MFKVFQAINKESLENEMNEWIQDIPHAKAMLISQSQSYDPKKDFTMITAIVYELTRQSKGGDQIKSF